jgi:probable selenate reductase FAD-binding subunit
MIPSYHRPASVAAALRLKDALGEGAVFLAGGTEVNNLHAPRPAALIDLAGLGLGAIEATPRGVRLGAGVTFQALLDHAEVPWFLKAAAAQMANRNVRNAATVGGHLGANRSCADLIPALLAAEARVALAGREEEVPVADVLVGGRGLILSVFVPAEPPPGRGFGLAHQRRTASDVSILTAVASLALDGERLRRPILAVGGVAAHVVRLHAVEAALDGRPLPDAEAVEALVAGAVQPKDDLRGSAAFKRQVAAVLAARALRAAVAGPFTLGLTRTARSAGHPDVGGGGGR